MTLVRVEAGRLQAALLERGDDLHRLPRSDFIRVAIRRLRSSVSNRLESYFGSVEVRVRSLTPGRVSFRFNEGGVRGFNYRFALDDNFVVLAVESSEYEPLVGEHLSEVLTQRSAAFVRLARDFYRDSEALGYGAQLRLSVNSYVIEEKQLTDLASDGHLIEWGRRVKTMSATVAWELETDPSANVIEWTREGIGHLMPLYALCVPASNDKPGQSDDPDRFTEGQRVLRQHLARERNQTVIRWAKERFRNQNGDRLFCEICGFDFEEVYGPRGEGYAEGHHLLPVSEMEPETETSVEDIAIVCSNCHRMLHRDPLLTPQELEGMMQSADARR